MNASNRIMSSAQTSPPYIRCKESEETGITISNSDFISSFWQNQNSDALMFRQSDSESLAHGSAINIESVVKGRSTLGSNVHAIQFDNECRFFDSMLPKRIRSPSHAANHPS